MDTFVDSAWYFLRYLDPNNEARPFAKASVNYAMPVDLYIGGVEHAILHLLYARFVTHFLNDFGYISNKEPFACLLTQLLSDIRIFQGMVHGRTYKTNSSGKYLKKNEVEFSANQAIEKTTGEKVAVFWEKMSKSKYNGVDPQDVVKTYGADAVRLSLLFKAPPDNIIYWDEETIIGITSWLNRLRKMVADVDSTKPNNTRAKVPEINYNKLDKKLLRATHQAIKQVTYSLEKAFTFNVAIAACMKLSNILQDIPGEVAQKSTQYVESLRILCILISPLAPHFASELWSDLCLKREIGSSHILYQSWPTYDDSILADENINLQIIINGNRKGTIAIPATATENEEALLQYVKESRIGQELLRDKVIKKIYIVKHRKLISFVTDV
ncbi:uncharacterized protein TRIADDRAFT_52447 [Trichoplax adhaerens]|uniref:leucine--tRNA ligase n=1 Tax=Trichoplax adhaerens TaxID=10228 RepID=B3RIL4_TRIAD|nr:hypothetical protein TRIADDRAFT_52447 [Trichoplax adhaerens]EDV29005.1 hypothetical protein TRIADDRAFT_52447 [Trichoplax adhaerens]|eukprot:XP_002108207.1 hypothetical protein TRIADDRAFT_52447 [Trichoplax adhaerens]